MKEPITTEKVTDASLTRSIISSIIGIVLCMACLFGTTWAWYSSSVTSGVSVTEGANFDFDISIFGISIEDSITPTDGVYTLEGGTYTVTLTKTTTGTAEKGFCKVEATKSGGNAETITYYIVDFTGEAPIQFTVKGPGTLKLIPMLGTPAEGYDQIPNDGIVLTPDSVAMTPQKKETPTDEAKSPTDGETGTSEGTTTEDGQTPPDAGETPPGETPTNPDTAEQEPPTAPISEATAKQPTETPVETTTQE